MDYQIKMMSPAGLRSHPKNPRVHPQSALAALERSITEFGWTNPVILSKDGFILAGHARVTAAKRAGIKEVPVIRTDLEGARAEAYMIADNRLQELTDWDFPALKDILQELDTGALDMALTGFSEQEIENLMVGARLPETAVDLTPRNWLRILISVPLDDAIIVKELVERIASLPGVEVLYGAN